MPSKNDNRRGSHLTSLSLTETTAKGNSNTDLERRVRSNALALSGTALASKSINDLRVLAGARADDA